MAVPKFRLIARSQRGQSLIQILITLAVMGVLLMAMVSIQNIQSRENSALLEKVSAIDVYRVLTQSISDSATCNLLFAPGNIVSPASPQFDGSAVSTASPYVITLRSVPGIGSAAAVATQNTAASSMTNSLFVPNGAIKVNVVSATSANLVIGFDQNKLVRPIHDLSVLLNLQTFGPNGALQISGCLGNKTPQKILAATDFAAMAPSSTFNSPPQITNTYTVNFPGVPYDQRLIMSANGIYNIMACGSLLNPCSFATLISTSLTGFCGQSSDYGPSSAYDGWPGSTAMCLVSVPANTAFNVFVTFDARGGAFSNFASAYTAGGATGSTSVLKVFSGQ